SRGFAKNRLIHFFWPKLFFLFFTYFHPKIVGVYGFRFHLDKGDTHRLSLRLEYEKEEIAFVKKLLKEGDCVADIGAHIGIYSIVTSHLVGKRGHVYAFEAHPENFSTLLKNVEENNAYNVTCEPMAVTNRSGHVTLFESERSGAHRLSQSRFCTPKKIIVPSIRMDDYFKQNDKKIDFIKMDIEGAEFFALQGMATILSKNRSLILQTEFAPCSIVEYGITAELFLATLKRFGFNFYTIQSNVLQKNAVEELLKKYPHTTEEYTNLFCMRR
ncbi:FkbM family methyltransferase, partial [Candidatus Uhrbacteria bacterium]|nr:FkbM family methyltransferase [Candidatus Uhrbacteria bacterium]